MHRWPKNRIIALGAFVVIVHALLLFIAIPMFSARLASSYSQDRFADGYDQLAQNLAAGNGYRFYPDTARTLMREPGYPLLLAGLFLLFGGSFAAVKFANMLLAFATALLMMRLARKLSSAPLLIYAPPLLFLFHPGTLIAESRGGVEILFAFLLMLFFLTVCYAVENNRWRDYIVCGIALGITALVRSVPIFFPLFLLAYLLLFRRKYISAFAAFRNIALMLTAMLVVLSPWIIRNYLLTGKFVPTASVLGVSAHAGQYIDTHLFEDRPWWLLDREAAQQRSELAAAMGYSFKDGYYQSFYKSADEITFSKFLFARVMHEYKESPVVFLKCLGYNFLNFWFAGKTWAATTANAVIQIPYLVFGLIGAVLGLKSKNAKTVVLMFLLMAYVVAVYLPILAQARYSIPLIPFISILASFTLLAMRERTNKIPSPASIDQNLTAAHEFEDVYHSVGQVRVGNAWLDKGREKQ
jgi:4-amino-4-deoxy-L-arabinose transferase-like glycosyltransferase